MKDKMTMKKLITIAAFAAFAVGSQAATITWGLGGEVLLVDSKSPDFLADAVSAEDASAPTIGAGSYLALVYVGQDQNSFDIGSITADSIVVDKNGSLATVALATDGTGYQDPYDTATITAPSAYSANSSFGIVWFNGTSFDYIYNGDDGSAITDTVTVQDMGDRGSGFLYSANSTQGYQTIVAVSVPEPGIACMALLGLGMLIKRRRA